MADSAFPDNELTETIYSGGEAHGMIVIVVASSISIIAEIGLLMALAAVALRPKFKETADYLFLQSNFGLYFVSLLVANAIAAIGSVMNIRWVEELSVRDGSFCTAQGAIKNIGNVATALWALIIANHVFNLLFLRHQTKRIAGIATTVAVWCGVGTIDLFGPAVLSKQSIGPYFGVAGYWCWITVKYPGARVGLEYFWFFFSGAMSFVLYVLVFLRLRGNIVVPEGSHIPQFIWVPRAKAWKLQANRDAVDAHMTGAASQMIWFSVAYTIIILPITVNRFMSDANHDVPFPWVVMADSLFMSSGLINVILFLSIRKALPIPGLLPTFNIPRNSPPRVFIPPPDPKIGDVYPYVVPSASSEKSFGDRDRNNQEPMNEYVPDDDVYVTNVGARVKGKRDSGTSSIQGLTRDQRQSQLSHYTMSPELENTVFPVVPSGDYILPSPPAVHGQQRQNSVDSLHRPTSESYLPTDSGSDYDYYTEYGGRRSEWEASLSAYFENVVISPPRAVDRFPVAVEGLHFPLPPSTATPMNSGEGSTRR